LITEYDIAICRSLQSGYVSLNLSNPSKVFDFDFQGYRSLPSVHDFHYPYTDGSIDYQILYFDITDSGSLHGAVFWFEIYMDKSREITLSNSPFSDTHWKPMLCLFGEDFTVQKGDHLRIEIARISERYQFAIQTSTETQARLVLVCNECDIKYHIHVMTGEEDVQHHDFVAFKLSAASEWNVLTAIVGQTIRATHKSSQIGYYYIDYIVSADDDQENGERNIRKFFLPCATDHASEKLGKKRLKKYSSSPTKMSTTNAPKYPTNSAHSRKYSLLARYDSIIALLNSRSHTILPCIFYPTNIVLLTSSLLVLLSHYRNLHTTYYILLEEILAPTTYFYSYDTAYTCLCICTSVLPTMYAATIAAFAIYI